MAQQTVPSLTLPLIHNLTSLSQSLLKNDKHGKMMSAHEQREQQPLATLPALSPTGHSTVPWPGQAAGRAAL